MKRLIVTAAAFATLTGAAFAQNNEVDINELFAMSNNSAAEIIVREGSMGDITSAQVALALGNMSAAERMIFLQADTQSQLQIMAAQMKLLDGDSAAESN